MPIQVSPLKWYRHVSPCMMRPSLCGIISSYRTFLSDFIDSHCCFFDFFPLWDTFCLNDHDILDISWYPVIFPLTLHRFFCFGRFHQVLPLSLEHLFLLGITTKATRGIIHSSDLLSACGRIHNILPKCYDIWWLFMQLQALSNAGHRQTRPVRRLLGVQNAKCLE